MEQYIMKGGNPLVGEVYISGAKNAALGILAASIMTDEDVVIDNLPDVRDINVLLEAIAEIGASVERIDRHTVKINASGIKEVSVDDEFIRKIRASYYFMGALLGRFGQATVGFPGGDNIGPRPIDQHIKGFKALGARVEEGENEVHITTGPEGLKGARIFFDLVSVGATINVLLAAVRAKGTTIMENVAREPEIIDLATFLNNMGAHIRGAGTDVIRIQGVDRLEARNTHTIIPDRIEAGTYLSFAAANGKGVLVKNVIPEHLDPFIAKLVEMGVNLEIDEDQIYVPGGDFLAPITVKTSPFPGFATDLQQPITPLLMRAHGKSTIIDTLYPELIKHIPELKRMGG